MLTKSIKVWLGGKNVIPPAIYLSQYDTNYQFIFTVYDGDSVWTIPEGASVVMEGVKKDGTVFIVSGSIDNSNHAVVECGEQLTAVGGAVNCELRFGVGSKIVGTANFTFNVEAAPVSGHIASEDDFSAIDQLVNQALVAAQQAGDAAAAVSEVKASVSNPFVIAKTASEMTDHEKGYVYAGSESGYTTGGWYYWNGTAWTYGGVATDTTLAVSGVAADAKAVGDALATKLEVTDVTLSNAGEAADAAAVGVLKRELEAITEHKNLLPFTTGSVTMPSSITETYNNGHVTVNGTSTIDGGRTNYLIEFMLPAGNYVFSVSSVDSQGATPEFYVQNGSTRICSLYHPAFTLTNDTLCNIGINVTSGSTYDYACDIQIEVGTTPTEYMPPSGTAVDAEARKYIPEVEEIADHVIDLYDRVTNIEEDRVEITATWTDGYYVNNVQRQLTAFAGFNYSDLIELRKGEGIQVFDAYTTTATVVDMLSRWNPYTSEYVSSVYPYSTTGYSDSTLYRATEAKEYIRVCFYNEQNTAIDRIKIYKYGTPPAVIPSVSMFERIGCCGDSYVKAQLYDGDGLIGDFPNLSWGKNIGRMYGITADIFASSGADTNTWQTRSDCLPALLASQNPCGLYVFCLGINDTSYVQLGSMADITSHQSYTDYPNTFYGNYGKIIEQIEAYSPNSKIILMPPYHPNYISSYVTPLAEISEYYNIAMINTANSTLCMSGAFVSQLVHGHPTAVLQSAMARDIANLIGECMNEYYDYFKEYAGV